MLVVLVSYLEDSPSRFYFECIWIFTILQKSVVPKGKSNLLIFTLDNLFISHYRTTYKFLSHKNHKMLIV